MFIDLSFLKYFRSALSSILFLCTLSTVWGQEEDATQDEFFREDQFYLGASFMELQSSEDNLNPQGLSRHLQWGFIRDIPLNTSGKIAAGLGLGMSFERLVQFATGMSNIRDVIPFPRTPQNAAF